MSVSQVQPRYLVLNGLTLNDSIILSMQVLVGRAAMCVSLSDDSYLRSPFSDSGACDFHVVGNRLELTAQNVFIFIYI